MSPDADRREDAPAASMNPAASAPPAASTGQAASTPPAARTAPAAPEPSPAFGFEGDRPTFPAEEASPKGDATDDFSERPHVYVGAAFVGGLVAAKVLGRITRG